MASNLLSMDRIIAWEMAEMDTASRVIWLVVMVVRKELGFRVGVSPSQLVLSG